MEYGNAIRELSADGLEREYRSLLMRGRPDNDPEIRFRLSLLLSNPEAPFYDLGLSIRLLEEFLLDQTSQNTPDAELAMLLSRLLRERLSMERTRQL